MTTKRNLLSSILTIVLSCWVVGTATFKAIDIWHAKKTATASSQKLAINWQKLIYGRVPILGTPGASFKIVEFSDYQCPFCSVADPTLEKFALRHPADVVIYRYDLPLTEIHHYAYPAAIAANCAELQGVREPYQSALFKHQKEFSTINWKTLAKQSGVGSIEEFDKCTREETPRDRIKKDTALAKDVGIASTPSFLINGVLTAGVVTEQNLEMQYKDAHKQPSKLRTFFKL